jgi:hypothetical protein
MSQPTTKPYLNVQDLIDALRATNRPGGVVKPVFAGYSASEVGLEEGDVILWTAEDDYIEGVEIYEGDEDEDAESSSRARTPPR